jgi:PAS domain S-box-containing protein
VTPATDPPLARRHRDALRVALIYAALGAAWILGSDWMIGRLMSDPAALVRVSAIKGWAFIGMTALMLYGLVRHLPHEAEAEAAGADLPRSGNQLMPLLRSWAPWGVVITVLTVVLMVYSYRTHRNEHEARLFAVAELRSAQIGAWVDSRMAHARFASTSNLWAEQYQRWQRDGDLAVRDQFLARMVDLRKAFGDQSVRLLDRNGKVVLDEFDAQLAAPPDAELTATALKAMADGTVQHTQIRSVSDAPESGMMDVVAPLLRTGKPAQAAIALRVNAQDSLRPILTAWPVPSASGSTLLIRRQGNDVVGMRGQRPIPISSPNLLAARALRGEIALGRPVDGDDFRGVPSIGVVHEVPGTDWYVVARVDRGELVSDALPDLLWIVGAGLLALFGSGVSVYLRSEQRELQRARQAQEVQSRLLHGLALMRAIAESSPDAIFAKDMQGRYLLCNGQAARLLGDEPDKVLGRTDAELLAPADAERIQADDRRVLTDNRFITIEEQLHAPDGLATLMTIKGPLRGPAGEVVGLFGIARDISDRKQAELVLREVTQLVQAVEDSVRDQMAVLDPQGRIVAVNASWREFVRDNTPSELRVAAIRDSSVGCNYLEVCRAAQASGDPAAGEAADGIMKVLAGESELFTMEYACHGPGQERWFLMNVTPLRMPTGGAVVVHSDVTSRRIAESEIERHRNHLQQLVEDRTVQLQQLNTELVASRDKAEAASRAKSAFLANMSHEIRTPLNAILGLTHLLRRDVHDEVEGERLRKVSDAANHLLEVISDILDLSKIESGRLELELVDFSLRALVGRCCSLLGDRVQSKGLVLLTDLHGAPDALRGDPTRLSQSLLNLLSNAVKFTDTGTVTVRCERLDAEGDGIQLRFSVIDTGVGIDAGKLENLFDSFVQADASTTRRFGGTGLGLAITRRLVEAMGGEAGANSRPGEGSEFWFTVRLQPAVGSVSTEQDRWSTGQASHRANATVAEIETRLRLQHGGARVLLVENNPVNQEVAVELLQSVGMAVEVADNGAEAITRARQHPPDLILMDVQMPVMDGLAATRALRTLAETANLPILAMTADAFGERRDACLAAGMDGHVAKPVDPALLYAALLRWLPAREPRSAAPPSVAPIPRPAPEEPAELPRIDGLDVPLALQYIGGRLDVFGRVLRQFVQHYGDGQAALRGQLESGDAAVMRALVHSIRGASSSIGASALAERAGALEAALIHPEPGDDPGAAGRDLFDMLQRVVRGIQVHLDAQAGSGPPPAATPISVATLDRLEQLLAIGDYQATAMYREIAESLRQAAGPAASDLGAHLRAFDFDLALQTLRRLRSEFALH